MRDEKVLLMFSRSLGLIEREVNWMVAGGSKGQERLGRFFILEWKCLKSCFFSCEYAAPCGMWDPSCLIRD